MRDPLKADSVYFQFPAWVEVCRKRQKAKVPDDLEASYFASLARLPGLIAAASAREWDSDFVQCAMAALAAAKGNELLAEASLELSPDVAGEFLEWLDER